LAKVTARKAALLLPLRGKLWLVPVLGPERAHGPTIQQAQFAQVWNL
jgi:hypothetical protein